MRSEFIVNRLLVTRSKMLWGRRVHGFHRVAGILVVIFGILLAVGAINQSIAFWDCPT